MIEADILRCLAEYQSSGKIPCQPAHPTNTCDPYTGNWAEHLMDVQALAEQLRSLRAQRLESKILRGYYGSASGAIKSVSARVLDSAIYGLGKSGLLLAPYFILFARTL